MTESEIPEFPAGPGSWKLGDIEVRRVGFGAMRLTGRAAFGVGALRDRNDAVGIVREALELGVNHFDTASFYFSSAFSANDILREALDHRADDVLVATKVGPSRDASGEWMPWARPEQLRAQVEANLRELGRSSLDLVYLRVYGADPIAEHVDALVELRAAGLLRHIGLSTVTVKQLDEARAITPIIAVQHRYGLGSRTERAEAVLAACGDAGIAFVPYFAIAGEGREAGARNDSDPEIDRIAAAHRVSAAQVRLAWTLSRGRHVLAIPGTGDSAHLRENIAAGSLELGSDDLARLDAIGDAS